jgi:hypothetical protein
MSDVVIAINAIDNASSVINSVASKVSGMATNSGLQKWSLAISGVRDGLDLFSRAVSTATRFVSPFIEEASKIDQIADVAAGLGETVADVQAFTFAMEEAANVSFETAIASLRKLRVTVAEIASGKNFQGQGAFSLLGLDAAGMSSKSPIAQFLELRNALSNIPNMNQRSLLASQVLGKSSGELSPAMIGQQFAESMEAFKLLHGGATEQTVQAIGAMNDAIARMGVAFDGMQTAVIGELAPQIEAFANWLEETLSEMQRIDFQPLIDGINEVAVAFSWFSGFMKRDWMTLGERLSSAEDSVLRFLERIGMVPGMRLPSPSEIDAAGRKFDPGFSGSAGAKAAIDVPEWNKIPGILEKLNQSIRSSATSPKAAEYEDMLRAAGNDQNIRSKINDLIIQDIVGGIAAQLKPGGVDPLKKEREDALKFAVNETQRSQVNAMFDALENRRGAIIANATPDLQAVESRLLTRGRVRQPVEDLVIVFNEYTKTYRTATKQQLELEKKQLEELHKQTKEEEKKFGVKIIK